MKQIVILFLTVIATSESAQNTASGSNTGWVLRSSAQGLNPCRAVKFGNTVDTQLLRGRDGSIVLVAGHSDWPLVASQLPVKVSISIDGGTPTGLDGYQIGRSLFVKIDTAELQKVVKGARTLHWHVPWGEFDANVEGLGPTFEALVVCPG